MRVAVDRERCIGAGMCVLTAPGTFDQDDDDGLVLLLDPDSADPAVRRAVQACPASAIAVTG